MSDPTKFTDVIYEVRDRAAWIIINRPKVYNAFRGQTLEELIQAFQLAANDRNVSSIVLTGAGDKAFCTGGDQSAHEGQYDGRGVVGLPIDELQGLIRDVPKPVIARVNGFAIGGGNVLATLCDLTIAADTAQFGQVGPKRSGSSMTATPPSRHVKWAWSTRSFRKRSWMPLSRIGPTSSHKGRPRRSRWRSAPSTRIPITFAVSATWPFMP